MSSLVNDTEVPNLNTNPVSSDVKVQMNSIVEKTLEWINEHKMFIIWGLIVLAGIIYITYFRNSDPVEESKEVDNMILGEEEETDELMKKLNNGLLKNTKEEHLNESSEEDDNEESDEKNLSNNLDDNVDSVSEDLNQLEEYTQESMDI